MNFVIAAGGTGGHLFPGLAVGEVLLARGHAVMLLISEKEIDSLATQGRTDFRVERVRGVGLEGKSPLALLRCWSQFRTGLNQVTALFRDFSPSAVLGMGGFTSTAPIIAGRARKIPTFVHESNAIPGKANKLNARLVTRVLLGFAECSKFFAPGKSDVTGTPIRRTLVGRIPKAQAIEAFGLSPDRKTLLVMGGSQGARGINNAIVEALPQLRTKPIQIIHLTGRDDEKSVREKYSQSGVSAFVAPFWHRMETAYSAADFCIARSGAASLTELSHFALPSVLIPYPFAAEDHQTENARIFERANAAVLMPQNAISGHLLAAQLMRFIDDPAYLSEMSARAAALASKDAAERVADVVLKASTMGAA